MENKLKEWEILDNKRLLDALLNYWDNIEKVSRPLLMKATGKGDGVNFLDDNRIAFNVIFGVIVEIFEMIPRMSSASPEMQEKFNEHVSCIKKTLLNAEEQLKKKGQHLERPRILNDLLKE